MLLYEPPEGLFPDSKIQGCLFYGERVFLPPRQRNVFSYNHICKSSCQKICSNTENRDFLLCNLKLLCQPLVLYNQQHSFFYAILDSKQVMIPESNITPIFLRYMIFFPNSIFPQSNSSLFVTFLIMHQKRTLHLREVLFILTEYFTILFYTIHSTHTGT